MLNMLNVLGGARRRPQTKIIQHIQHFSRKNAIFQKISFFQGKCWICWILGGLLNKNVLLSGEMLNMLNVLGKAWGPPPPLSSSSPQKIQHIQHFPWKKHIFSKNASFSWNVEYVEFWGACWIKMCFFLQKCWICWICWMFWGKPGDPPPPYLLVLPQSNSTYSTYSTFPLKEAHFLKKMLLSGEMLNMLNSGGPVE